MKIIEATVDGEKWAFSDETEFLIQVGKGRRGSYKTRYSFKGNQFNQVCMYYRVINIGNGYKKRLVMAGKVVRRCFS